MKIVKIRTVLLAGLAGGTGYVLGTRAGRGRFEELKVQADKLRAQAEKLARSPQVHETVGTVADKLKESATKLPDPVADAVTKVADSAHEATTPETAEPGGTGEGTPLSGVTTADVAGPEDPAPETSPGV